MLGLALGLAFLCGAGIGAAAMVVWLGIGSMAIARGGLSVGSVLAIAIAAGLGAWIGHVSSSGSNASWETESFEGRLVVIDGPFLTQSGQRFIAEPERAPGSRFCAYAGAAPRPLAGDRIFARGDLSSLRDLSELGEIASSIRGCNAQLRVDRMQIIERGSGLRTVVSRIRITLSDWLMQAAPGDRGALLSGLVTGDDGGLSDRANQAFLNSGTTHITAISGANFATITLLLSVLATGSMRRNIIFVAGASAIIWLYALMVGLEPSAFRAALLATAVLAGRWFGRRPDLLTLTVLLAAAQIAIRPRDLSTLAFQLSIAATIALIVVFDGVERGDRWSWPVSLGITVMAAQLATVPVLAWTLGTMSGAGLLANLVVGPMAGLAFPLALTGALLGQVIPMLGGVVVLPAIWLCHAILIVVEWCDRTLPGTVQLGAPTFGGVAVLTLACWSTIFWASGDLRRMTRHGIALVRSW